MNTVCQSCVNKYGPYDIHSINNCCYNTCANFVQGTPDDVINSACGRQCKQCIQKLAGPKMSNHYRIPVIDTMTYPRCPCCKRRCIQP